ncbi:MAG: hypothetical protein AAGF66_12260 [Cyanobacteria bacterium P01_H01_bin.119]
MGLLTTSSNRYWEILCLDPSSGGPEKRVIAAASQFFQGYVRQRSSVAVSAQGTPQGGADEESQQRSRRSSQPPQANSGHLAVQRLLLLIFQRQGSEQDVRVLANAGLCLRCYVSHGILLACRQLAYVFSGTQTFHHHELLPFVLDDDGSDAIVLNPAGHPLKVLGNAQMTPLSYARFTVEVIRRFDLGAQEHFNLNSWIHYQTRQQPEIKQFLSERGFSALTDWALLNQINKTQLSQFSDGDRAIVQVFHQVYRRDRRQGGRQRRKCPNPTPAQLQEMAERLGAQQSGSGAPMPAQILPQLHRIAKTLRQLEVWQRRGMPVHVSLNQLDETGQELLQSVVDPRGSNTVEAIARQELQAQLPTCLKQGVIQGLRSYIDHLHQRPRYRALAHKVVPALRLIYQDGQSQAQVAERLNLTNQAQVSRLLNLKELLNRIRHCTVNQVQTLLLKDGLFNPPNYSGDYSGDIETCDRGAALGSPTPAEVAAVIRQIEQFVDAEVLLIPAADAAVPPSAQQTMTHLYRQYLAQHLAQHLEACHDSPR